MPIKTFRGLMTDETQDTIVLHTNDGSIGYRIVKFEAIGAQPGEHNQEHTLKIYKVPQTVIDNTVDFSNQTLVAVCYIQDNIDDAYPFSSAIIFDSDIFNQDIYITHVDTAGSRDCNYYIELEQIKLDLNQNTVATLKDIRNVTTPT